MLIPMVYMAASVEQDLQATEHIAKVFICLVYKFILMIILVNLEYMCLRKRRAVPKIIMFITYDAREKSGTKGGISNLLGLQNFRRSPPF